MSAEHNKALVQRFCQYLNERNLESLFGLLADDGSWSIPYRQDRFQFAGHKDKQAVTEMVGGFLSGFTEFSFCIQSIVADGDHVAIEAKSAGKGPGQATYANVYAMHFIIRNGQIHTIREYFDPFQVLAYVEQLG